MGRYNFDVINKTTDLEPQVRQEYYKKAQAAYDQSVAKIRAAEADKRNQFKAALEAWQSKSAMEQYWGEFARVMDERLALDRRRWDKTGPSKTRFTDLTIVKSVDTKEYAGIAALIDALIHEPQFQGNYAASLHVYPPEEAATGHAVAILRQNTGDEYHLFDPNFGVYKLPATRLREAVVYIFKSAYPNLPTGNKGDNKPYEVGGKVKGDYMIFEGQLKRVPHPLLAARFCGIVRSITTFGREHGKSCFSRRGKPEVLEAPRGRARRAKLHRDSARQSRR